MPDSPSASTPRIARMLRELQGPPRDAGHDAPRHRNLWPPEERDSFIPAALAIGGAALIALAAWQAWELTAGTDGPVVATRRQ